jgi:flagellar basal-body rod protein FlgB
MSSVPLIPLLERYLQLTSKRQELLVGNMANVDTPGYQTRDIDFQGELRHAMDNQGANLTPVAHNVRGLLQRPDGNNVDLEREGMMVAENQMQYRIGIEILRSEFHRLLTAIKEGNGS